MEIDTYANAKRVVVKLGSETVIGSSGKLNGRLINHIAEQTAVLMSNQIEVAFVVSGAVAVGRRRLRRYNGDLAQKQVLASNGQIRVAGKFAEAFERQGIEVGQHLLSEGDAEKLKVAQDSPRWPLLLSLQEKVVPVINANDTVNTAELEKLPLTGDNDKLAKFVADLISADTLIFLTRAPGVWAKGRRVIRAIESDDDLKRIYIVEKTGDGTGGIESKVETAVDFAKGGGQSFIARGSTQGILLRLLRGENVGTRIYYGREYGVGRPLNLDKFFRISNNMKE